MAPFAKSFPVRPAVAAAALFAAAAAAGPVSLSGPVRLEPDRAAVRFSLEPDVFVYVDSVVASNAAGRLLVVLPEPDPALRELLGKDAIEGSFDAILASREPFPEDGAVDISFQACSGTLCHPPETLRLRFTADGSGAPADPAKSADEEAAERLLAANLSDFRILRKIEGAREKEEFLAFLRGDAAERRPWVERALGGGGPLLLALALLAGGLLLNLTPCVLPLVPVNLALLGAGAGRTSRRRGALQGAAFGAGIALAFGSLGLFSALTGRAFGFLQASPVFHAAAAAVFCLLALAMLDVVHVDFSRLRNLRRRKGPRPAASGAPSPLRAFLAGAGSALLSGACVAPVLVSALVLSADLVRRGHPVGGALVPFALGLGMALPSPLLGAGLSALPKPGAWMNRVKLLFALVFFAAGAFYAVRAWRMLSPAAPPPPPPPGADAPVWLTLPSAAHWAAKEAGPRPVLLVLGADWCKACHWMDERVLADPEVSRVLANDFFCLRVDCTRDTPETRAAIAAAGAHGLPFFAVLEPKP